jgi:hypothetical protein
MRFLRLAAPLFLLPALFATVTATAQTYMVALSLRGAADAGVGERITFTADGMQYEGRVNGGRMEGTSRTIADRNEEPGSNPEKTFNATWKAEQR